MSAAPELEHEELIRRIRRDLLDSWDEEIEMDVAIVVDRVAGPEHDRFPINFCFTADTISRAVVTAILLARVCQRADNGYQQDAGDAGFLRVDFRGETLNRAYAVPVGRRKVATPKLYSKAASLTWLSIHT